MSYIIKFGDLKGMSPEDAYNNGEIEELIKIKNVLLNNFNNPKYEQYKKTNLEGYLAIEEVILKNYQPLLKKFNELFNALSEEKKENFQQDINKEIFYNYDIIGIRKLIENIKTLNR
ncbi:hypothetical protein [Alkaliphilus sp. B6464]|uniref:hypothetical protein n=1 Tax=Alkaliphilus sp. B6464 TaxID=2731219 RepID=UPI001BA962D9|nr:hypothetical protein [Alkaliphilus sp. B6464]QUH21951.1 hypothetical protein HYG84_18770 [Alkaliphilus sp. B6464]